MAIRTILHDPDPRLRQVAQPVATVDDEIRRLVDDMAEPMYAAPGIGLAAVQINVALRVVTIDLSETHNALQVFINPEIIQHDGKQVFEEGCLSVPGIYDEPRPGLVDPYTLTYRTTGKKFPVFPREVRTYRQSPWKGRVPLDPKRAAAKPGVRPLAVDTSVDTTLTPLVLLIDSPTGRPRTPTSRRETSPGSTSGRAPRT